MSHFKIQVSIEKCVCVYVCVCLLCVIKRRYRINRESFIFRSIFILFHFFENEGEKMCLIFHCPNHYYEACWFGDLKKGGGGNKR